MTLLLQTGKKKELVRNRLRSVVTMENYKSLPVSRSDPILRSIAYIESKTGYPLKRPRNTTNHHYISIPPVLCQRNRQPFTLATVYGGKLNT